MEFVFGLTFLPMALFGVAFRKCWLDEPLKNAALGGVAAGAAASLVLKFAIYPGLQMLLGVDLRTAIAETQQLWEKAIICIFMVGGVEESAKLCGTLVVLLALGGLSRPPAAFLASLGVALGFSALENLDYFSLYGLDILVLRAMVSTTGHLVFTGLVGAAVGVSLHLSRKKGLTGYLLILGGLATGAVLHGLFNLVAFESTTEVSLPILGCGLLLGMVLLYEAWMFLLRLDRTTGDFPWQCLDCGLINGNSGRFCRGCGTRRVQFGKGLENWQ